LYCKTVTSLLQEKMNQTFTANLLLIETHGMGQLLNLSRKPILSCHAVFKLTNPFVSSCLVNLESNFNQRLPESSRLAISGKLAYYCHTNDLSKTNTLARLALAIAIAVNIKELKFRLTETEITKGTHFRTVLVILLSLQLVLW